MRRSEDMPLEANSVKGHINTSVPIINWIFTWQGFNTLIMMGIWFLLPLKYGGNVNPTETAMWNQDLFSWIFSAWPVFTFPLIGAVALVVVLVNRRGFSKNSLLNCLFIIFPGLMVLIASLIGWINTTEQDVAYLFSAQLLGVVVLVSASFIHIQAYPQARRLILISICAGSLAVSAMTWHQKYYMYPRVLQSLELKLEQGKQIDQSVISKLRSDTKFSGTFSWKNTLGAHLILLFPVCTLLAWRAGRYFEPPRASSVVISCSVLISILGALWFSKSLASSIIITIMVTGIALFWLIKRFDWQKQPQPHRSKLFLLLLLITIGLGIFFQDWVRQKGFSSLYHRFQGWEQAILMFKEEPLIGVGMGEYYTHFTKNKPADAGVTRFAHSLFLCFLSQCGVFGGSLAWAAHSLLDFDIQVPATVSTFLILPSLGLKFHKDDLIVPIRRFIPVGLVGGLLVGICLIPMSRLPGEKNYKIMNQLIKNGVSEKQIYVIGEKASQGLPHSPYPSSKIAQVALHFRRYEYAVEQLKESIRRTPHRSTYYAGLAQVYEKMGRTDDALTSIEQALLWFPTNEDYKKIKSTLIKDSNQFKRDVD